MGMHLFNVIYSHFVACPNRYIAVSTVSLRTCPFRDIHSSDLQALLEAGILGLLVECKG